MRPLDSRLRGNDDGRVLGAVVVILVVVMLAALVLFIARLPTQPPATPAPAPPAPPPAAPVAPDHVTEDDIRANNRGVGLMGRYEYDPAREIFAELLDRRPDWLDVRVNLAIATLNRQQDGDEAQALRVLREVLDSDPRHLRAQYVKGILLLYQGERDDAMAHLSRVAERDPADAHAAYFIGQIHAGRGEHEDAIRWYDRAIARDPYLRSAYYGKSRALFALGREDEAEREFEAFQRLEPNPRAHTAEFIYTRMGPKAMAMAVDIAVEPPIAPEGPIFLDAVPLLLNGDRFTWRDLSDLDRPVSVTVADISGNGLLDVFIAGALDQPGLYNAVCMNIGERGYVLEPNHPLARIPDVNAALWGDVDNDGLVDVYLCRRGPNILMHQTRRGEWRDITEMTGTAGGNYNTVNGLLFDADHDGDLDVFLVNEDGPNELLNNNRDGTFTPIAQEQGIAGGGAVREGMRRLEEFDVGRGSRQVIALDLENDRDLDIIVINDEPPHEVYINDRLWQYRQQRAFFRNQPLLAVAAGDTEANGRAELFTVSSGRVEGSATVSVNGGPPTEITFEKNSPWADRWYTEHDSTWSRESFTQLGVWVADLKWLSLAIADIEGRGQPEPLLVAVDEDRGLHVVRMRSGEVVPPREPRPPVRPASMEEAKAAAVRALKRPPAGAVFAVLDAAAGPSLVAAMPDGPPMILRPGPGRHRYAALSFTGRDDPGHALRSNASGIGTHYAARIGSHWVAGSTLPSDSGPGQSLQPVAIGMAGHQRIDFVAIDWSDGVFQSEIDLAAGELHKITETQRQLASCPILFAWNGERYEFASDVLGVGGIGFAIGPGEYAESRPWEYYLFKEGLLAPKDGRYVIKIGEPMEEALYLDTAALVAYDLPPGWSMTVDERMGISDPQPTGDPIFYRHSMLPVRAVNDRGEDLTEIVREQNYKAAPPGELDLRFIGRLAGEHVLTIEFEEPIDFKARGLPSLGGHSAQPYLVADGWIEYPYSQTVFAAWQAGADYRAPTLEARDPATGNWQVVLEQFGYPAGFARQMAVPIPLDALPAGARELRLRTNQEIYWDRLLIVYAEDPPPEMNRHELEMVRAEVKRTGFAQRVLFNQRRAYYDYDNRHPLWDTRHQSGFYTRFGDVLELVRDRNDALAIIGPGEEIHIEFAAPFDAGSDERSEEDPYRTVRSQKSEAGGQRPKVSAQTSETKPALTPLPAGWTRRFVIELRGWCKDMDLYTKDGETLEPLPSAGLDADVREDLHRRFNTRYRSGR